VAPDRADEEEGEHRSQGQQRSRRADRAEVVLDSVSERARQQVAGAAALEYVADPEAQERGDDAQRPGQGGEPQLRTDVQGLGRLRVACHAGSCASGDVGRGLSAWSGVPALRDER
jgi:hypothetical protein